MAGARKIVSFVSHRVQGMVRRARTRLTCWRCRGNGFHCPLCVRDFRRLLPSRGAYWIRGQLVDHYTANSICPSCGSGIRHRFVFAFLRQKIAMWPAGMKVLHFAPEPALFKFFRRKAGLEYVPGDLHPNVNQGVCKIDILNIGFPDNHFDLIVCIHVLEHIAPDLQAMRELYRVLKPGGSALLAVPIYGPTTYEDPMLDHAGRVRMYGIGDHMRLNGLDMQAKLEQAGFAVDKYSTDMVQGNYMDHQATSPHIETDKHLFWCHK